MLTLLATSPVTAEILDTLPNATDPFALSLNENPFPPLPAVRSALIHSIEVANRYPEFLPEAAERLSPVTSGSATSRSCWERVRAGW